MNAFRKTAIAAVTSSTMLTQLAGCGTTTFDSFLNTVKTDLANGTALTDLQSVVVQFFPSFAGQTQAIATVLQAAINLLLSTGVLTVDQTTNAKALLVQIQALQASSDAGSVSLQNSQADQIISELHGESKMSNETVLLIQSLKGRL
jgi:hypothetical protein